MTSPSNSAKTTFILVTSSRYAPQTFASATGLSQHIHSRYARVHPGTIVEIIAVTIGVGGFEERSENSWVRTETIFRGPAGIIEKIREGRVILRQPGK